MRVSAGRAACSRGGPRCVRRSPSRRTSSTRTASTSTSATPPTRSSPTAHPTPASPATPSCTTAHLGPGAKLPHAWITCHTGTLPTLDTVGKGRFTPLTGIGGDAWVRAAAAQPLDIATVVIEPGQEYEDPYGDRANLSEMSEAGALLVRPDGYVAFRHAGAAEDAGRILRDALRRILGHG